MKTGLLVARRGAIAERTPYAQGIDFRATSGFVTDPSGFDAEIGTTANYPRTTAQGHTVGWEQAPSGTRDRSSGVDARLAGIAFNSTTTDITYRLDLPNGTYSLRLACGDQSASQKTTCTISDGTTVLSSFSNSTAAAHFLDATGVIRTSAADWVTNNAPLSVTITTGILRIAIRTPSTSSGVITTLSVA